MPYWAPPLTPLAFELLGYSYAEKVPKGQGCVFQAPAEAFGVYVSCFSCAQIYLKTSTGIISTQRTHFPRVVRCIHQVIAGYNFYGLCCRVTSQTGTTHGSTRQESRYYIGVSRGSFRVIQGSIVVLSRWRTSTFQGQGFRVQG